MDVCTAKDIHEAATRLSGLTYCFTPKHHGAGVASDSRWLPDLSRLDEFQVFDMADLHQFRDDDGDLYGLRIVESAGVRRLLELGIKHELVARFWAERQPEAHWHGHPLWPILTAKAQNRAKQGCCPPAAVFTRMAEQGLMTVAQARRLKIGKSVSSLGGPRG